MASRRSIMDKDQEIILFVYSLYSSEEEISYLQYTAALVLFFYLKEKGHLPNYKNQLLLYDYKESRRYLWEDKKFMNDINIVRDHGYLIRSRVKTSDFRDVNAHQCSTSGKKYVLEEGFAERDYLLEVDKALKCKCGSRYNVVLADGNPELSCEKGCPAVVVNGFLKDVKLAIEKPSSPAYL